MIASAFGLLAGLTIGNFVWEAMRKKQWRIALERSFFQAVALGGFVAMYH